MTRINLVDPSLLSDKHLLAEHHEMLRPLSRTERCIRSGVTPIGKIIPDSWRLGTGHEKFYMDKLHTLHMRYQAVVEEITNRGMKVDTRKYVINNLRFIAIRDKHEEWYGSFEPTHEQIYWNMARLAKRGGFEVVKEELQKED